MEIAMFILFFLMDLFMVFLCRYAYRSRDKYSNGMIMGVHIPAEESENTEVQSICRKSRKDWNSFHRVNLALGGLVCTLCFYSFEIFVVVWMVWLCVYVVILCYLINAPHREMYRLKVKKNWVDTKTMHMVCIDTELASLSKKMYYSWKWHLPVMASIAVSGVLMFGWGEWSEQDETAWILFGAALVVTIIFLAFHMWIERRQNVVYSQNTEVNFAVNRAVKRAWTAGFLAADMMNGIAWIFLSVRFWRVQWLDGSDYLIYSILQMMAGVFFLLPIIRIHSKKQRILEQDTQPVYVDDDEYWKNGWYNNPNDSRLMVQDRMCSMNFTFNMAKPAAWIVYGITAIIMVGTVIWVGYLMLSFRNAEVAFSVNGSQVNLEAAGYECNFSIDDIESVEVLEQMPDEAFSKTNGGATDKYDIGYFRGKESGKCMLFLFKDYTPILRVKLADLVVYANSEDSGEVEKWYSQIQKQKDGTDRETT